MTTTGVKWVAGFDVHVIRGQPGRQLDALLRLSQSPTPHRMASDRPRPADVSGVVFNPRFVHGPPVGNRIEAHRVRLDVETGLVEALTTPSLFEVDNFLVDALVTVNRPAGTVTFPAAQIRVHVHGDVTDAWLTPARLSVRVGADGQRLSVLAQFDDGTVGDVGSDSGIRWSGGSAAVQVDPLTGALTANASSGPVTITATLPAALGGLVRTAQVEALPEWSSRNPEPEAVQMSGPGVAALDRVPNVLVLGDGFVEDDEPVFEQLAHSLEYQLRTGRFTSPFDLLSGSVNYWRAFVPSPETGATVLHELYQQPASGGGWLGYEVPRPIPPVAGETAPLRLAELVHEVGLPVPADAAGAGKSDTALRVQWLAVFGVGPDRIPAGPVGQRLIGQWRAMHNRGLAMNERDTAFGLAFGSRPQVNEERPLHAVTYHPHRTTRAHLDQFLAALVDKGSRANVGRVWNANPRLSSGVGKDRDLVVVLSHGGPYGGGRTRNADDLSRTDLIALGLVASPLVPLTRGAGTLRFETKPTTFARPPTLITSALGVAAHELAHSFGLGDEYGNRSDPLTDSQKESIRAKLNLQLREDLGAGPLRADAVRWRWPRLRLAATLTAPPVPQGGDFLVRLDPRHSGQFFTAHRVRLRQQLPLRRVSAELEVRAVDRAANTVLVHDSSGTLAPIAASFEAGSVLCVPRIPAAASAAGDEFLELMSQLARERIDATNGPLNAPELRADRPCTPGGAVGTLQPGTNWPAGTAPRPPRYSAWIIGLYEGGEHQGCAVLHPAGVCLMRAITVPDVDPRPAVVSENYGLLYPFCHVCRYILVDRIDAAKHGALDDRIVRTRLYPQPE